MKPHPHAKLMAEYAKDAAETETPWERWQTRDPLSSIAYWGALISNPSWMPTMQYRRKPRAININGYEVPEPMWEAPEKGAYYYLAETTNTEIEAIEWLDDACDKRWLSSGICHTTKEAATEHAKALLSFTQTTQNND